MSLNHRTIKIAFATVIAILIAQFFQLNYSVAAGVIAILSVLDTKKSSVLTALQRIASTVLGIDDRDDPVPPLRLPHRRVRRLPVVLRTVGLPLQSAIRHRALFGASDASVAGKADKLSLASERTRPDDDRRRRGYFVQSVHALQSEPNHFASGTSGDANEGSAA